MRETQLKKLHLLGSGDWVLFSCLLLLMGWSVATLGGLARSGVIAPVFFWRQLGFALVAGVTMVAAPLFDYRLLREQGTLLTLLYLIGVLALAGLFFLGTEIRGTRGWYLIGGFGLAPVEFVKVLLLAISARFFSGRYRDTPRFGSIALSFLYFSVPVVLVLLEPDWGSAVILLALWLGLVVGMGLRFRQLMVILAGVAIVAALSWMFLLQPYHRARFYTLLDPAHDPQGVGWQLTQSTVAVGSGGWWGKGLGEGTQTRLHFLPEVATDFIFSAIAEEWGLVGVTFLFAVFALLLLRIFRIALSAENNFARIFAFGSCLLIFIHFGLNVGMNIGLVPVVGLPLPFLSYGGSHLVAFALAIGVLQSISARSRFPHLPPAEHV